ncbi:single-stranded DNA-binding protein [Bifidobacterium tibiigranuli]|jgi:single-strand DNA-binding protein|uniref:single-stranded DNA-binding protein n=1 Tax=Bifidobacterium tibiigranuli TaxID=2172043 RepID=UPI0026F189E6|nr:single-stranded DNA-binding protein [Bifidobacterium tibiigranuli]MCI1649901.1 single-stranded DNA-binding protein [Bifidobacterium tibiigranuli]MCI2185224.1 single-stranded DNA-binding protein [Bifidobacterium tibiigranuli]MCI2203211.1 single-stranded DNA-binding protein [Bifidobacterium tibiigranuli]
MAQQGIITITGFVGANPIGFGREGKTGGCSFRVGSTRSYFHAASGEWKDQPTTWLTVKAFRTLAVNVLASVRKGDPVIVSGLLNTEEWQQDGGNRSRIVIEASAIGHDLSRGVGSFQRQNAQRGQTPGQLSGQSAESAGSTGQSAEPSALSAGPPANQQGDGQDSGQEYDGENAEAGEPRNAEEFAGPEF